MSNHVHAIIVLSNPENGVDSFNYYDIQEIHAQGNGNKYEPVGVCRQALFVAYFSVYCVPIFLKRLYRASSNSSSVSAAALSYHFFIS